MARSAQAVPDRLQPLLAPESPVQQLAARLADRGHSVYLVGGTVRDAFLSVDSLSVDSPDVDLATDARPDAIEAVVRGWADAVWVQGQRFGTVGCEKDGLRLEVTTFRAEVYRPESRKPEVTFSDDVVTDLSRRDFTINAMAIEIPELQMVDPFGGLDDLVARRLRTPLEPDVSFIDDPLRMMRAARFIARFGLVPDDEVIAAVQVHRGRLSIVSAERIRDELSRLLVVDDPAPGLWFLVDTGLMDEFLPEITALRLEQDPIHRHKDVLAHTIAVTAKADARLRVRLAAILHDIGKPRTREIGPNGVTFHHHEVVGARMARDRMRTLRYPNDVIDDVTQLVYLHLRFHTYRMGWSDKAVRRYVRDAGPLLDDLNHLVRCDCTTRNKKKAERLARRMDELEARIEELRRREELESIKPPLNGHQVMQHLGVAPGPVVGDALDFLLELRIDEGPIDESEAYRLLDQWAREHGLEPVVPRDDER